MDKKMDIKIYEDNGRMVIVLDGAMDEVKKKIMEICSVVVTKAVPSEVLPSEKVDVPPTIPTEEETVEVDIPTEIPTEGIVMEETTETKNEALSIKDIAELFKADKDNPQILSALSEIKEEMFDTMDKKQLQSYYQNGFIMFKTVFEDVCKMQTPPINGMSGLKSLSEEGVRNLVKDSIFALVNILS